MKIGLLVAMEEEIRRLRQAMDIKQESKVANQLFYDGRIDGKEVTLVQAGIGKVNAAIATTLLIQQFGVEVILHTGSAGALAPNLNILDLVLATHLSYHDADNQHFGYSYGQIPQMPAYYSCDDDLSAIVAKTAQAQNWTYHEGLIVSGDSFVADRAHIQRIQKHFPNALVAEMEGAAVAQTCAQFNVPQVVIRAVSDTADDEATIDFDRFVELAGAKSAELVLATIKELS